MKLDDHFVIGLFIGIVLALNYAAALGTYMPIFLIVGLILLLRLRVH